MLHDLVYVTRQLLLTLATPTIQAQNLRMTLQAQITVRNRLRFVVFECLLRSRVCSYLTHIKISDQTAIK